MKPENRKACRRCGLVECGCVPCPGECEGEGRLCGHCAAPHSECTCDDGVDHYDCDTCDGWGLVDRGASDVG